MCTMYILVYNSYIFFNILYLWLFNNENNLKMSQDDGKKAFETCLIDK